ncbi:hypothetical protein ACVGXX_00080, partial [Enterobacter intestinihominis]
MNTFFIWSPACFFFKRQVPAFKPKKLTGCGLMDKVCILGGGGMFIFFNSGVFLKNFPFGGVRDRDP